MKVRNGFVSNSSSSSFIISGKGNIKKAKNIIEQIHADYYELDGVLYTSLISDGYDEYSDLNILAKEAVDGGHDYPYNEEYFFEFEGDRGVESVYIEKHRCKDKMEVEQHLKDKLYDYVKKYIVNNGITCDEMIHQNDEILTDAPYFLQSCCEIIGYEESDYED